MAGTFLDEVDGQLKDIINSLHFLILQAHGHHGPATVQAMSNEIKKLIASLTQLCRSAQRLPIGLPPEVIQYVESSRNPDIYTREFVELVQKLNQQLKGRTQAYADFRDILAREIIGTLPDCQQDVRRVVESTGGRIEG